MLYRDHEKDLVEPVEQAGRDLDARPTFTLKSPVPAGRAHRLAVLPNVAYRVLQRVRPLSASSTSSQLRS